MEFQIFIKKLEEALRKCFPENYRILIQEVKKNNGLMMHGLIIKAPDKSIAPTLFLEAFFDEYKDGTPLAEILEEVLRLYQDNQLKDDSVMQFFLDYSRVKNRILYKLVNYEKNREMLKSCPHIRFQDLAIVFYCMVINDRIRHGTVTIQNEHLKMWNVTVDDLYECAKKNNPRLLGSVIENMHQMIIRLMHQNGDSQMAEQLEYLLEEQGPSPMYVLTNHLKLNGAACILDEKVLQRFAEEQHKDIIILPSSIHEVILVPTDGLENAEVLHEMVHDVNQDEVAEEEILSEEIYFYSRLSGTISQLA